MKLPQWIRITIYFTEKKEDEKSRKKMSAVGEINEWRCPFDFFFQRQLQLTRAHRHTNAKPWVIFHLLNERNSNRNGGEYAFLTASQSVLSVGSTLWWCDSTKMHDQRSRSIDSLTDRNLSQIQRLLQQFPNKAFSHKFTSSQVWNTNIYRRGNHHKHQHLLLQKNHYISTSHRDRQISNVNLSFEWINQARPYDILHAIFYIFFFKQPFKAFNYVENSNCLHFRMKQESMRHQKANVEKWQQQH